MTLLSGAVLCGGASSRFGMDKALAPVAGKPMALRAVQAMRDVGVDPIVAIAANEEQGARLSQVLSVPSIVDRWPGEGPLGGLLTALLWYRRGSVLTLPCDLPLVTGADLEPLRARFDAQDAPAVVAATSAGPNCTIGIWPAGLGPALKARFDAGARRLDTVLDVADYATVTLPERSVEDADTEQQLRRLLEHGSSGTSAERPPDGPSPSPSQ